MEQLLEWMEIIEDARQHRKVCHSIKDILIIVLFATLANADTWEQIADFALWNEEYLRQYIELKNGIPSHDTIQRVMGMIRPENLQQLQRKWLELLDSNEGEKLKKSSVWMGKPCVPIKGKEQNHAILFLHGAGKTDIVWGRKQWKKRAMR